MTPEQADLIAEACNRLPMVRWDRAIVQDDVANIYGWIPRHSGRSDFVLLTYFDAWGWQPQDAMMSTSSAEFSEQIDELLRGTSEGHIHCQRITDVLGDRVERVVGQSVSPAGNLKSGTGR